MVIIVSVAVQWFVLSSPGKSPDTTALSAASALAGALAVLASVISGWIATRVVELQEDTQKPYPYPYFDVRSRTGLLLVVIKNFGGSSAHDVCVEWDDPPIDMHGKPIVFGNNGIVPVLLPNETISAIVDGTIQYFGRNERHDYGGYVKYANASGRSQQIRFVASAEKFARTPRLEDEVTLTYEKLQALPDLLKEISRNIEKVADGLARPTQVP
ncbi:MAG TPA: hypothetical protein VKV03_07620 [Candidatus Binataceae bacterium]|nr:hypothetical protein [Candidatus Binataceae bacterium]